MNDINKDFDTTREIAAKKIIHLCTFAGAIMLVSGAEISRVEDTIYRMCISIDDVENVNVYAVPYSISLSFTFRGRLYSWMKRTNYVSLDLNKIDMINNFSRKFVSMEYNNLDKAVAELEEINNCSPYPTILRNICGAASCGFFSILFGGAYSDFFSAFIVGFLTLSMLSYLANNRINFFIKTLLGAILSASLAVFFDFIGLTQNIDKVIIGAIMCLVPGIAMTNSIRDSMSGDFTTGLSRLYEAIFTALAIALGVGIIINMFREVI